MFIIQATNIGRNRNCTDIKHMFDDPFPLLKCMKLVMVEVSYLNGKG